MSDKSVYTVGVRAKAEAFARKKNRTARTRHYTVKRIDDKYGRTLFRVVVS